MLFQRQAQRRGEEVGETLEELLMAQMPLPHTPCLLSPVPTAAPMPVDNNSYCFSSILSVLHMFQHVPSPLTMFPCSPDPFSPTAITVPGDDNNYGSSSMLDVTLLQALSKRIHYGMFVAEAKFRCAERDGWFCHPHGICIDGACAAKQTHNTWCYLTLSKKMPVWYTLPILPCLSSL